MVPGAGAADGAIGQPATVLKTSNQQPDIRHGNDRVTVPCRDNIKKIICKIPARRAAGMPGERTVMNRDWNVS